MDQPKISVTNASDSGTASPNSIPRPHNHHLRNNNNNNSNSKSPDGQVPAYRHISIDPSTVSHDSTSRIKWKPVVSFDSIPLVLNSDDHSDHHLIAYDDDDDDGEYDSGIDDPPAEDFLLVPPPPTQDDNSGSRGRGRSPSPAPFRSLSPHRTRSPSPYGRGPSSSLDGISQGGYPTSSNIKLESFLYTKQTAGFRQYVKENGKRVIMCYVTGRRHTWIALDYVVTKLLRSGDELVVVSRIPDDFKDMIFTHSDHYYRAKYNSSRRDKKKNGHGHFGSRMSETAEKLKDKQQVFRRVIDDLVEYIELITPSKRCDMLEVEITIDLYLNDSTLKMLNECIDIYHPVFIVTATKPNLRFTRSTTWKSSRITDRLVKNYDIPILIVPSLTSNDFEMTLFENLSRDKNFSLLNPSDLTSSKLVALDKSFSSNPSFASLTKVQKSDKPVASSPLVRSETSSVISDSDTDDTDDGDDDDSSESSSVRDLTRTITNYHEVLDAYIEENDEAEVNTHSLDIFLKRYGKVLDISKKMGLEFQNYSINDDASNGAELVRSLTGFAKIRKTKSMLDDIDVDDSPRDIRIQRLRQNLAGFDKASGHSNNINNNNKNNNNNTPRAIKFSSDIGTPSRLKQQTKTKTKTEGSGLGLMRYKTNTDDNQLHPQTSAQRNRLIKSLSESRVPLAADYEEEDEKSDNKKKNKKKKKKGFLTALFKR